LIFFGKGSENNLSNQKFNKISTNTTKFFIYEVNSKLKENIKSENPQSTPNQLKPEGLSMPARGQGAPKAQAQGRGKADGQACRERADGSGEGSRERCQL